MMRPYAKYIAIATLLVMAIFIISTTTDAAIGFPSPTASNKPTATPSPSFGFTYRPSLTVRPSPGPGTIATLMFNTEAISIPEELDGEVRIKVLRGGNMTSRPEVKVSVTDHTATPEYEGGDWDFQTDGPSDIARFDPDEDSWFYTFIVKDDSIPENDEYFNLTLSEVKDGIIGSPNQMRIKITSGEKPVAASPTPYTPDASVTPDASSTIQPSPSGNDPSPTADVSASPTTGTDGQTSGSNAKSGGEFMLLSVAGLALASLIVIRVKKE